MQCTILANILICEAPNYCVFPGEARDGGIHKLCSAYDLGLGLAPLQGHDHFGQFDFAGLIVRYNVDHDQTALPNSTPP